MFVLHCGFGRHRLGWTDITEDRNIRKRFFFRENRKRRYVCEFCILQTVLQQVLQLERFPSLGEGGTVVPWKDRENKINAQFGK